MANVVTMKLESVTRQPVPTLPSDSSNMQHEVRVEEGAGEGHRHYDDDELKLIADTNCTCIAKEIFFLIHLG